MDLADLIKDVLNFHGFVVESDSMPIKARKGEEKYTVVLVKEAGEREIVEHMETEEKLLVISLTDSVKPIGDEFWDRKTFESMVGKAAINRAMGGEDRPRGSIIGSFEDAFVEHREPVASRKDIETFEGMIKDAFSSVQELHPYYTYHFDIDDTEHPDSGILLVGALEGDVFRALKGIKCDTGALSSVPRIEPRIADTESLDLAVEFLMKEHAREEDVVKEEGTVTVVEKRIVGIGRDKVHLRFLGITYVPILMVEGAEGMVKLDMSGILDEKGPI